MKELILSHLTPFKNVFNVLIYNQGVGDIISGILLTHKKYAVEYDKISKKFWKGSASKTAKAIFDFLKLNTHYIVEADNKQTLRSPAAILYMGGDRKTGLDCKSYSLFIAGILDSLKRSGYQVNWAYRFASYKPYDKLPHHVFVVLNPGTANEVFVDPVLPTFNYKKQYFHFLDKKPMALIAMAGIGRTKKTKARKQKIKAAIKKRGKVLLKFNPATVSSRNAFLLLVKVNAFNLGRRLYKLLSKKPQKLKSFWEKIGGNYKNLEKNILQGAKQKAPIESISGIGVVPAIAAAIAAATPIVLKVTQLLKSVGIDVKELETKGAQIVKNIINKKIDQVAESDGGSFDDQDAAADAGRSESDGGSFDDQDAAADAGRSEGDGGSFDDQDGTGEMGAVKKYRFRTGKPVLKIVRTQKPQMGNFA